MCLLTCAKKLHRKALGATPCSDGLFPPPAHGASAGVALLCWERDWESLGQQEGASSEQPAASGREGDKGSGRVQM